MTIPNKNHPWKKYETNVDILKMRDMLLEKGFSVSQSYVEKYVRSNMIPGFYKIKVGNNYNWYISLQDAKKFVKSFDYFGRNK